MKVKTFGKTAAFGLAAAALTLGAFSAPAQADPPPEGVRVGAGSDTTQDVLQGISVASGGLLESWHASPNVHSSITPKPGFTVTRPNGSSEGRDALRRSRGTNVNTPWATQPVPLGSDVFDFARSSSGPGTNASLTGQLVYVPFALDAVTTATGPSSTIDADQFTLAQLRTLYRDGASVTVGGTTYTPDVNITLLIPQSGSGTRQFWADQMQINATTLPAWVHDNIGGAPFQEHDGSLLAANPNAIGPYSIAQWIAQGNSLAGVPDRRNGADLHNINGVAPYTEATPGNEVLNTAFPITRQVYNIVSYDEVRTGGTDATLRTAFNGPNSRACTATTGGQLTITTYGFGSLGSGCGAILETLRAFPNG
ncbi:substrate-binding domain-containing protein [Jiangella alkaliphila]|uniref:ABC-type phosphate transport system, substrate-binding protein n=1 Tax=Jiangella alkaliphila TaxID=419479 RepID=A0A1H2LJN7_9ACTN|nr:substrate-binding domain-containing protein [Jiangella alkaliphila]SDU81004.1 ABC-type phosphate transport system, substrate-binding protein [Jiangella alkaliphila]